MKNINLPIGQTITMTLTPGKISDLGNGHLRRELGQITSEDSAKAFADSEIARENGGRILYAATAITQKMEDILMHYFMGTSPQYDKRKNIFRREILQSSALSYRAKKDLIIILIQENELLSGGDKNKLQKYLSSIMSWRNAFAHGKIHYHIKNGCILDYHSGGAKKLPLTDSYWDDVVSCFLECNNLLDQVINSLTKPA